MIIYLHDEIWNNKFRRVQHYKIGTLLTFTSYFFRLSPPTAAG